MCPISAVLWILLYHWDFVYSFTGIRYRRRILYVSAAGNTFCHLEPHTGDFVLLIYVSLTTKSYTADKIDCSHDGWWFSSTTTEKYFYSRFYLAANRQILHCPTPQPFLCKCHKCTPVGRFIHSLWCHILTVITMVARANIAHYFLFQRTQYIASSDCQHPNSHRWCYWVSFLLNIRSLATVYGFTSLH